MPLSKKNLVCCAMPFGYGPVAKLMTIAGLLRPEVKLIFIGRGIAYELASRSRGLFDRVIAADATEPIARQIIGDSIGVLSIMEREFSPLAVGLDKPLYVVDSLLWMRDRVPAGLTAARIYWAQNFPGLDEVATEFYPAPTIVGPVVPNLTYRYERSGLLINLGGCRAPDDRLSDYLLYARFVLEGIIAGGLPERFPGKVTVTGGADCIEILARSFPNSGIDFLSLSHDRARARMAASLSVLTAPGLTTTLECFGLETPTFFLPPENYSQWCILRQLRQLHLAPHAFHPEDIFPDLKIGSRLPETDRQRLFTPAFTRMMTEARAKEEFHRCLRRINFEELTPLARAQNRFFRELGRNGAETIAAELLNILITSPSTGAGSEAG